jgi:hypothetical protein
MDQQNPGLNTDTAGEQRTRELRAEIDRTREDLSETVNAIQDRLRPSTVASHAAESVKHAAMSKVRDVAGSDSVSYMAANPVPMTMVAIGVAGLAWLATAGRQTQQSRSYARRDYSTPRRDWSTASKLALERESSYGYDDDATVSTPGRSYASSDRAGRSGDSAYGTGATDDNGVGYGTRRRSQGSGQAYLQRAWRQNPLMLGVAAAVAGAVVGIVVPETERESELMGETRDRMLDSVHDTVRDKVDQVQQAATTALSSVQEAAKDAIGLDKTHESQERAGQGPAA